VARTKNPHMAAIRSWETRRTRQGQGSSPTQVRESGLSYGKRWTSSTGKSFDPKSGGTTADVFRGPDGQWDPKRVREVWEPIIQEALKNVPVSHRRTVYMLGGGPASGKSSIVRSGAAQVPSVREREAVGINPDDVRSQLPEWDDISTTNGALSAPMTNPEARAITGEIMRRALANGQDVVWDASGNHDRAYKQKSLAPIRAAGYRVVANYVALPTEEAYKRSVLRARSKSRPDGSPNPDYGRFCEKEYFVSTHASISRQWVESADLFDEVRLYSGPGYPGRERSKPILIAEGGSGRQLKVHETTLWAEYLMKGNLTVNDVPDF
jgi:predicted ABC-type ATPase